MAFLKNGDGANPVINNFGQVGTTVGGTNVTGSNGIIAATTDKINDSANKINALLESYDPSNPASLLQAQQALSNYNLSLTVASSFIKSVESTAKAIAQNVS